MGVLPRRFLRAVVFCLVPPLVLAAGCGTTVEVSPQTGVGVLSAMHQRALNAATVRAIEQAGVDEYFLGSEKTYLDVKAVGAADLGKQHVSGAVLAELDTLGALILDDPTKADSTIHCFIHVAGTDPDEGGFLFWKWKEVRADVELSFSKVTAQKVMKKQGVGRATYSESWFLGMGPETKIK